ncbi:MAG: ParA family protein [Gallionella sp.]
MKSLLVANPKGGSGKTTLATNIAGYLASQGKLVRLLDLDRQKSASRWLDLRPTELPFISEQQPQNISPGKSDWLVIDSPAGLHGKNLDYALRLVDGVIVPIAPSLFDIDASRDFLKDLRDEKAVRKKKVPVGVVGMRMDARTRAALILEEFLATLDLPVLAYLREAQVYVNAAFEGRSLFDLPPHVAAHELEQWRLLLGWLDELGAKRDK